MIDYNNIILDSDAFNELRHRLSLPDVDAIARRDSALRDFSDNVRITRNGTEVVLDVDDEYLKSLSKNNLIVVRDEISATELLKSEDWSVALQYDSEKTDTQSYRSRPMPANSNRVSITANELFAA